jgi:opacity protein-like surface antigen
MKKVILISFAIFSFSCVSAQNVNFGLKAGVNFASINGDETDDLDSKTSFHLGAVAEIELSEKLYFGPEILYSSQGAKLKYDGFEDKINLNYVQVPLMIRYYITEGFNIEAGPQISFLIDSEYEDDEFNETIDLKDDTKDFDYGLNLGLGYKLNNSMFLQGRYNLGLANILEDDTFENNNTVIQLSFGYMF